MDSTGLNSAMDGLIKNGYLRKLSWNTYSLEEYTADEIAYRKYIKRNGNVEGVYAYESAAYHAGIIEEKPEMEYVFTNMVQSEDSVEVKIADRSFRVRESKISGNPGESEDAYRVEPADVCGGKTGEGGGCAGMDGREWDDEAETSVVCEGVSF